MSKEAIATRFDVIESGQRGLAATAARLEEGQTALVQGQTLLVERQTKLEERQAKFEARQIELEEGQARLEAGQEKLAGRLHKLELLHEDTRNRLQLVAESVLALEERMERGFARLSERMTKLERAVMSFVRAQGVMNRRFGAKLSSHERLLTRLEKAGR